MGKGHTIVLPQATELVHLSELLGGAALQYSKCPINYCFGGDHVLTEKPSLQRTEISSPWWTKPEPQEQYQASLRPGALHPSWPDRLPDQRAQRQSGAKRKQPKKRLP